MESAVGLYFSSNVDYRVLQPTRHSWLTLASRQNESRFTVSLNPLAITGLPDFLSRILFSLLRRNIISCFPIKIV